MRALKSTPAQESGRKQDLVAEWTLDGVDNNDVAKINEKVNISQNFACQLSE